MAASSGASRKAPEPSPPRNSAAPKATAPARVSPEPLAEVHKFVVTAKMKREIDAVRARGTFTSEAETLRHILKAGLAALKV